MKAKSKIYSWDFETTTDENDCRVWAWASVNVNDWNDEATGTSIDSFIDFISKNNCSGSFHNLKFDGESLLYYLFRHNFKLVQDKKRMKPHQFYTLISDKGQFYEIIIKFDKTTVKIRDSYKLLPFSVEQIAVDFGLPIKKLSIDYKSAREIGHILTKNEKEYVLTDARIVAMALKTMYDSGLTRMTIGGNALHEYKDMVGNNFKYWFPIPTNDAYIRKSYKGGFTYCNPKFAGKVVGSGIVLDVNSLYPSVMANENNAFPVGNGVYYEGKYEYDNDYPLYFQRIIVDFKIKPDHLPTIQIKGGFSSFIPTEYLTDSNNEMVELTLTCIDLQLFLDHYDVIDIIYVDGFKYMAKYGLFTQYIVYWTEKKVQAKRDGNKSMYILAKLMLNNLYGKFSTSPKGRSKYPVYQDELVKYVPGDLEEREAVYIPVGSFITAYARNVTIRSAQKVYDRFMYADTDSLHLIGDEVPVGLDIDDYRLGAWKHESSFVGAKFIRAKTYMEHEVLSECEGMKLCKWKITCAGMPKSCYKYVTIDNFTVGTQYNGKLVPKHVKGGIVLKDTTFKILDK